jgi:hypothetical protein
MSPGFASSFISLRGAPDALRTGARCQLAADQQPLRTTISPMGCLAQRNEYKGTSRFLVTVSSTKIEV